MALSSSFGFTNETASWGVTPSIMEVVTGFGTKVDDPEEYSCTNSECPVDQQELVTFQCKEVKNIASKLGNQYPPEVQGGVQYVIRLDELLKTTSSTDDSFRVDDPIVMYLTVRHPLTSRITTAHLKTLMQRLLGSMLDSNGEFRYEDLMKSALRPAGEYDPA